MRTSTVSARSAACFTIGVLGVAGAVHGQESKSLIEMIEAGYVPPVEPSRPGWLVPNGGVASGGQFFDNEADFLAAVPGFKAKKGVEDFEEAVFTSDATPDLDSPLCSGIPNLDGI